MFGKTFSVFFAVAAAALSASALSIETPEKLTQCNTVTLQWHGKKAPFTLAILPSCESDLEDPLLEIPAINATTYKWTVNFPSKTGSIAFAITDAAGNEAYTDEVEIGKSNNVACFNSASSSAPSSTSSSVSSTAVPKSTGVVTTSGAVTPTTLVVPATYSATSTPSAPLNVGANSSPNSGSSGTASSQASGAIANAASVFASMVGVATGLLALL